MINFLGQNIGPLPMEKVSIELRCYENGPRARAEISLRMIRVLENYGVRNCLGAVLEPH